MSLRGGTCAKYPAVHPVTVGRTLALVALASLVVMLLVGSAGIVHHDPPRDVTELVDDQDGTAVIADEAPAPAPPAPAATPTAATMLPRGRLAPTDLFRPPI